MPGRLRSSYRSGNLAEDLGLLLLKGIAALAEVSRPEDVGLDAIASLLRRDPDGNCYAEDTFVVQLKSDSATALEYRNHELKWLVGQSQPMFIGLVSLNDSRISLYPTLYVNQAVLALNSKEITIRFGKSGIPSLCAGVQTSWVGGPDHSATVWLGEPLLKWTLDELADPKWSTSAYEILKRYLGIARREYELLSFGQYSQLEWSTNDRNSIQSALMMMKGHPDDLPSLAEQCMPGLNALLLQASSMPEQSGNSLMIALICLVAALRDLGADIDPENLFAKFSVALLEPSTDTGSQEAT